MKSDKVLIKHAIESAEKIERFLTNMTYEAFAVDEKTISAVVRELMVIGEALANLSDQFKEEHNRIPFQAVVGMRNRIVHEYWAVDEEVVWKTCTEDVPGLTELLKKV